VRGDIFIFLDDIAAILDYFYKDLYR